MHFLFILLMAVPFMLFGQGENVQSMDATDADWSDGSILLNNGSELKVWCDTMTERDASTTYDRLSGTSVSKGAKVTITQTHTIYFLGTENKIQPYLQVIHKIVDKVMFDRDKYKNKILDKKILEQYLGRKMSAIEKYAKEQKLDLDEEADLLKILDYWDRDLRG